MYLTVFPSFPLLLPGEGTIVRQVIIKIYIYYQDKWVLFTL